MPRQNRTKTRFFLLAVLPAIITAGVAAASLYPPSLPNPANCGRDDLLRWVVTRDLTGEPLELQTTLARRLEQEFRGGVDWDQLGPQMTDLQRQQLWQNLPLLLEAWLREKAHAYATMPKEQQRALLDQILSQLATWRGIEAVRPEQADVHRPNSESLLALLQRRMQQYVDRAPSPEREQMGQLLLGIQTRGLAKQLGY